MEFVKSEWNNELLIDNNLTFFKFKLMGSDDFKWRWTKKTLTPAHNI